MRIAGLEKFSTVDYPGKLAAVVFTPGCNFDCFYCHNQSLLNEGPRAVYEEADVLAFLESRKGLLDAVVITGGEPTLQPGLDDFIRRVRARGFLVKLDTNGTRPSVVRELLQEALLDYVAMDIKAPRRRYEEICRARVDLDAIDQSIALLRDTGVTTEFRTTVAPQLTQQDVVDMARWIAGAQRYVLQQFRRPELADEIPDLRLSMKPHASDWPFAFLGVLESLVGQVDTRGFESPAESAARA